MQFITTTELQRKPQSIGTSFQIITSRGKPRGIALPYFEGNMGFIEDYLEAYEISQNRANLQQKMQISQASGLSSLVI